MNRALKLVATSFLTIMLLLSVGTMWAADVEPNKKRGRVYFKMVCTVCHIQEAAKPIPPNTYTMAEWQAYMDAGKHDLTGNSNPSLAMDSSFSAA